MRGAAIEVDYLTLKIFRVNLDDGSAMKILLVNPPNCGRSIPEEEYGIDTIKMIAYRAETAMATIVREKLRRHDDARSLLRAAYATEADLIPDENAGTLTVRLHHLANRMSSEVLRYLCEELNATMTRFPGASMRLVYELVS